jgi:hypothetical protein
MAIRPPVVVHKENTNLMMTNAKPRNALTRIFGSVLLVALLSPLAVPVDADSVTTLATAYNAVEASAVWDGAGSSYIFGGHDYSSPRVTGSSIIRFTAATGQLSVMPTALLTPISGTSAVWDGMNAYIFGGWTGSTYSHKIMRYTPSTGTITYMASTLPMSSLGSLSAVWDGSSAYIFGSAYNILKFTPSTDTLVALSASLPQSGLDSSAVWDGAGHAYVFGGSNGSTYTDIIVRFTPQTNRVEVMDAKLPSPRSQTAAVWDAAGDAYIFGGTGSTTQVVRYTPATQSVTILLPNPSLSSTQLASAVWDGSNAYIFQSSGTTTNHVNVQRYTPSPPSAPSGLTAAAGPSAGSITLHWNAAYDGGRPVTSYTVLRGLTGGSEAPVASGGCANLGNVVTCTDSDLGNGATRYYKVQATNGLGTSPQSAEAVATTFNVPSAPQNLQAQTDSSNGIGTKLTWTAPTSNGGAAVTNYALLRGPTTGTETQYKILGNGYTYTDSCDQTACYYEVAAINAAGQSAPSNEVSTFGVPAPNPQDPPNPSMDFPDSPVALPAVTLPPTDGKGYVGIPWGEQPIVRDVPVPDASGRVAILFFLTNMPSGSSGGYATLRALDPFGSVLYSKQDQVFFEDGHDSAGFAFFEAIPTQGVANLQISYGGVTSDVTVDRQVPVDPCQDPDGCLPCSAPCAPQPCNVLDAVPGFCGNPGPGTDPCDHPQLQYRPPCQPLGPINACDRAPTVPVACKPLDPICSGGIEECVCNSLFDAGSCGDCPDDSCSPCADGGCDLCQVSSIECIDPGCDGLAQRVCRLIAPTTGVCAAPSCYTIPVPLTETTPSSSNGGCGTVVDSGAALRSDEQGDDQATVRGPPDAEVNYTRVEWAHQVTYTNSCDHSEGGSALFSMGVQWSGPRYGFIGYEYPLHAGFIYHGARIHCTSQDYDGNQFSTCTPQAYHDLWVRPQTWAFIPPGVANFTFRDLATVTLNGYDDNFKDAPVCNPYATDALIAFKAMATLAGMAMKEPYSTVWGAGTDLYSDWATKEACQISGTREMPVVTGDGHRIGNGVSIAPNYKLGISIQDQKEVQARVMVQNNKCTTDKIQFATGSRSEWSITAHTLYSTEMTKASMDGAWTQRELSVLAPGKTCRQ